MCSGDSRALRNGRSFKSCLPPSRRFGRRVQKCPESQSLTKSRPNGSVEEARRQGVNLSRRKLADWHRAGLIPEPDRAFLGGPDGSESIYPRGTLRQVIACSILMKQFSSIERVGWELWMRRFPVAEQHWREPLREAHSMFQLTPSLAADDPDLGR